MHAQNIIAALVLVASVSAGQLRTRQASAQCGNGQVLSCCNSRTDSSDDSVLGGTLSGLLGGNCDQLPINVIGANGILNQACGSNNAACCTGNYNGLVNIACDPISL